MIKKIVYYIKVYGVVKFLWYTIREAQFAVKTVLLNTYTPFGDDIIIDNLLGRKKGGFYIDIGAYDPTRFSNTKRFYLRGWRGINIEPNPKRIGLFNKYRPRDMNLNIGVASKNGFLNFFRFEPESLSTFSSKVAKDYQKLGFKLIDTTKIKVCRLDYILSKKYHGKSIDFLSIDTEGFDLEVLKSNNWSKYRPKLICLEIPSLKDPNYDNPERKLSNSTKKFLAQIGYKEVQRTIPNIILQDFKS